MKKEADNPNERAKALDELKKSVEDLERAVAEWHSHNPEEVEREFREWERGYKDEVGYDSADPAIQELIDKLLQIHRESRLKEAAEAKKNPPTEKPEGGEPDKGLRNHEEGAKGTMRKLDILGDDKQGGKYHWYAIDIDAKKETGETCCSTSGKGGKCEGFKTEKLAKEAGDEWNKTRTS